VLSRFSLQYWILGTRLAHHHQPLLPLREKSSRQKSDQTSRCCLPAWCTFASPSFFGVDLPIRKVSAEQGRQKAEVPGLPGYATSVSAISADGLGLSCRFRRAQVPQSSCRSGCTLPVRRIDHMRRDGVPSRCSLHRWVPLGAPSVTFFDR
jgi:hypothetical protein